MGGLARPERVEHDIGSVRQVDHDRPVVGLREVGDDGSLARVQVEMERTLLGHHLAGIVTGERPPAPHHVTVGRFHLDHVGPRKREEAPGVGSRHPAGQLYHPDSVERRRWCRRLRHGGDTTGRSGLGAW